jgi:hypothetical protein
MTRAEFNAELLALRRANPMAARTIASAPYHKRARPGDRVYNVADPRHVGTITIIHGVGSYTNLASATVRWANTGWLSYEPLTELELATEED